MEATKCLKPSGSGAYLAHVVAAKFLSGGRPPEIIRAERIVPEGRQHLRRTRLFGGAAFDPKNDQLFKVLVEEGERVEARRGPPTPKSPLPSARRSFPASRGSAISAASAR
jgi:hypothetical protein